MGRRATRRATRRAHGEFEGRGMEGRSNPGEGHSLQWVSSITSSVDCLENGGA
jgi:hypothetical protein